MRIRRLFSCSGLALFVFSVSIVNAQEEPDAEKKDPTLDELVRAERSQHIVKNLDEIIESLEAGIDWADQMIVDRKTQCLRAIGHDAFCQCLAEEVPMRFPSFPEYVIVLSQTKEEIEYDSLDEEIQQSIDKVYKVRDTCVRRAFLE